MAAAFLAAIAIPLTDVQQARLNDMSSDLRFILSEHEVPDLVTLRLIDLACKSTATFSVVADDKPGVRAMIAGDIVDAGEVGLTPAQVTVARTITTQLMAVWMIASQRVAEEVRVSADSKALRLPAVLGRTTLIALRQRYERDHGRVPDAIWPCASLIESRLEEAEEGSFSAPLLSEVISTEAASDEMTTISEVGVNVRIRKAPKAIGLPATTEELRTRFQTLAISYVVTAYKHSTRLWLRTATMDNFNKYVTYLLSDEVSAYHLDQEGFSVKASWATVLNYELQMRKLVVRFVLYDSMDFGTALTAAMQSLTCKERFFITPTAIMASARGGRGTSQGPGQIGQPQAKGMQNQASSGKGNPLSNRKRKAEAKAAGKGNKTQGSKGGKAGNGGKSMLKKTPDGRLICGFFNSEAGCVKPTCRFVHVCSLCYSPTHTAFSKSC